MDGDRTRNIENLFVDQINLITLLYLCFIDRSLNTIWFFDQISPFSKKAFSLFRMLGLIRAELRQNSYNIIQTKNSIGECEYVRIYGDMRRICDKIKHEHLTPNPLINALGSLWPKRKIVLYFDKLNERHSNGSIYMEGLRIGLIDWITRNRFCDSSLKTAVLIQKKKWFPYLVEYAESLDLKLIGYKSWQFRTFFVLLNLVIAGIRKISQILIIKTIAILRLFVFDHILCKTQSLKNEVDLKLPAVGIDYSGGKLSFDPSERSEFFWLDQNKMPFSEIILYNFVTLEEIDEPTVQCMRINGIRLVGQGPGISNWNSTSKMFFVLVSTLLKIAVSFVQCHLQGRPVSLYYVLNLLPLAKDYAYWYDFFSSNDIKINIGSYIRSVGQVLALDALKGISIAYQYSISNSFPSNSLSSGANVQFVFSKFYEQLWHGIEAPSDAFLTTGYIYDTAFKTVVHSDRIPGIRNELERNGADFIICFFDENSVTNRWDLPGSPSETLIDYEYLLTWLLSDLKLGIICKPKRSRDLFNRISPLSDMIREANSTGRCKFIMSDSVVGSIYPAEAALISDLSIGKLSGATAALESQLVGIPSVLIGPPRINYHPFFINSRNRVVFDDWQALRKAVEQFRSDRSSFPEFGNWASELKAFDPHTDGNASRRMGLFVKWLYDAFTHGKSKNDTLGIALEKYTLRWL